MEPQRWRVNRARARPPPISLHQRVRHHPLPVMVTGIQ
jgi:hypothetical protein